MVCTNSIWKFQITRATEFLQNITKHVEYYYAHNLKSNNKFERNQNLEKLQFVFKKT